MNVLPAALKRLTQRHNVRRVNRLSRLQKWILIEALSKLRGEGFDVNFLERFAHGVKQTDKERLYTAEIKAGYYGFEASVGAWKNLRTHLAGCGAGDQQFQIRDGSAPKYRAACAAISRTITRLEKRELVAVLQGSISHWTAVKLTDLGKQTAEEFLVPPGRMKKTLNQGGEPHVTS